MTESDRRAVFLAAVVEYLGDRWSGASGTLTVEITDGQPTGHREVLTSRIPEEFRYAEGTD